MTVVSTDGGATWPHLVEVFRDPAGERGYLEHKLADLGDGTLLATAGPSDGRRDRPAQ